jgi:predicted transcriptional regulator
VQAGDQSPKKRSRQVRRNEGAHARCGAWRADEPRVWFTSTESFAKILSGGNRELLRIISEAAPGSIEELAQLTGVRSRMSPERLRRWQAMDLFASNLASSAELCQESFIIGWKSANSAR